MAKDKETISKAARRRQEATCGGNAIRLWLRADFSEAPEGQEGVAGKIRVRRERSPLPWILSPARLPSRIGGEVAFPRQARTERAHRAQSSLPRSAKGCPSCRKGRNRNNAGRKGNLTCKGKYTVTTDIQPLKKRVWRFKDKSSTINCNYNK